ncbi:alpha/beta hydrolase [Pusillimonas sp. CC-YST705]|uniref:Alpha/beta hydrolase n=1 Tax=Mesopusillimonas faecipullorum TaxID=2755040 RepID=A0ABS8C8A7_9BURK|nr:alpha/beta hydrolase [Mesopusillimonas faecipullorum]MCB5362253.1 alpha/beta hydrolase [Mesopusillimonas faecipullorum]
MKIVLIHGSWHTGEHWQPVADHLRKAGYEVHTPTVAGHGKNVDKNVNHADCTRSIVDYITANNLSDFVLLGHSYGGTIISKVAEAVPERIRRLVYWNAFVLNDGESLNDATPPHYQALFDQIAGASTDNTIMLPFQVWREAFINDADLELAQQVYDSLSSEPYQPFVDKLDLKKFYTLTMPRSYINCTEDIALPPGEYGWHPRMSSRLGLHRLVQLSGSHEVMFTAPARLAEAIIAAARD